jgi:hypothetical protein
MHMRKLSDKLQIGDKVSPKTAAGLCLADTPIDGAYNQDRTTICVFRGQGVVLKTDTVIIDYSGWPGAIYHHIGKVAYQNCLIECEAGTGWTGSSALSTQSKTT